MPAELLYGKPIVDDMILELEKQKQEVGLGIIQVGDLPESTSYVNQVERTAKRLKTSEAKEKLHVHKIQLAQEATMHDLRDAMFAFNKSGDVTGYMVQLPLGNRLQPHLERVRRWIAPEKDIDLLGHEHRGILTTKKIAHQLVPPTPYAVMKMLKHYHIDVRGKIVAVVGDGEVGKLLKLMLGHDGATQIILNNETHDSASLLRLADIVVGAADVPDIITGDMIKPGAVVINVGLKEVNGKMHGNVQFDTVKEKASKITPIMGGLGPVTVAALFQNVFRAGKRQRAI